MKKLLAILVCLALCSLSFVHVAGAGNWTITVLTADSGFIFIDGNNETGGTITRGDGERIHIEALPNPGHEIESVTIGSTTYSTDGEIGDRQHFSLENFEVNEDIEISAVFRPIKHTITTTVTPENAGTISPMNPEVNHGSDITFTITPNAGYTIVSVHVDGDPRGVDNNNQIELRHVENDMTLSVEFEQADNYKITTVVGPNGSVTPENPEVTAGSDVTFTITPDPGYIIDSLYVDGRPEMADESGQFTAFNVQRDMTLEVDFMQAVEHTITVLKPENGGIRIEGESDPVPDGGSVITRYTRETASYFITPDRNYSISGIILQTEDGEDDISYAYYYDETAKQIRVDVETEFDYTFIVEFTEGIRQYRLSIIDSEAESEDSIKEAVRRELGSYGMVVENNDITIVDRDSFVSVNGIDYEVIEVSIDETDYLVYTVEKHTYIVLETTYHDGGPVSEVYIVDNEMEFTNVIQFEIPADPTLIGVFSPYGGRVVGTFDKYFGDGDIGNVSEVLDGFNIFQLHFENKGDQSNKGMNVFQLTLITADTLCMNVQADSETSVQQAMAWDIDTFADVTKDNATHAVFFGNDRIILELPNSNIGNIASISTGESKSPGYSFENNPDGSATVVFHSDFYDNITAPLTITLKSGETVQRNLTILRVGVDIQAHDGNDGNPSLIRNAWHGTQTGNTVDLTGSNKFIVTASYYIPDFGDELPYGLFVTRKYADGRIETQIITQPMTNPYPWQADMFNHAKKMYIYNDGASGWANIADYLIYEGPNAASAPVEISVLVLKNVPAAGNTFGGINYGSGTGVKWTKP